MTAVFMCLSFRLSIVLYLSVSNPSIGQESICNVAQAVIRCASAI